MDDVGTYLRDLIREAKEVKRLLEKINDSLGKLDRIDSDINELRRTVDRKSGY